MNDNHLQIDTSLVWKINKKICIGIINNICCQWACTLVTALKATCSCGILQFITRGRAVLPGDDECSPDGLVSRPRPQPPSDEPVLTQCGSSHPPENWSLPWGS